MEFLMDSLLIGIVLHRAGGICFGALALILLFLDYYLEHAGIFLGKIVILSTEEHVINLVSYFILLLVFTSMHIRLTYSVFHDYSLELEQRMLAEKRLRDSNELLLSYNTALTQANNRFELYAFKNSHEVRAPICRLLGLAGLIEKIDDAEEKEFIIKNIISSTYEVDTVVREMNRLLLDEKIG
jgi:hypothetical protein